MYNIARACMCACVYISGMHARICTNIILYRVYLRVNVPTTFPLMYEQQTYSVKASSIGIYNV
jgi:hypothetical protein